MIPLCLSAAAISVLWWPRTRAEDRLAAFAPVDPHVGRAWHLHGVAMSAAPVVAVSVGGLAAGVASGMIVLYLIFRRRRRVLAVREQAADDQLGEALSVMIAEMSVGAPAARACAAAARELAVEHPDSEVAEALSRMAGRARLGGEVAVTDIPPGSVASWRRVVGVWQISDRHGLPMLDLLEVVRSDMVARRSFGDRTRAGLAGPRATALVLAGLPVLGIALGQAMGAAPLRVLLGDGIGGALLVIGVGLVIAGVAWSDRITSRVVGR